MIVEVIYALVTGIYLPLPLNRVIEKEDGVDAVDQAAQMLCLIESGEVSAAYLEFSETDKAALQHSLEEYEKSKAAFAAYIA